MLDDFAGLRIQHRNLLEARMEIASYNQHTRLLSSESWSVSATKFTRSRGADAVIQSEKDVTDVRVIRSAMGSEMPRRHVVLVSLAAVTWAIYDRGVQAGRRDEASSQVRASKTEFERIESAFAQQLSAANSTADKYHDVVAALLQQAQQLAGKAQAASVAETADKQ